MSTKKYKLLRDLPYVKAGATYELNEQEEYVCTDGEFVEPLESDTLTEYAVTKSYDGWFELVNEGVEVVNIKLTGIGENVSYHLIMNKPIPEDKLSLIKEAISKCINEEAGKCIFNVNLINKRLEELKDCKWVKDRTTGRVRFVTNKISQVTFYDDGVISGQPACACNYSQYEDCTPKETANHWLNYIHKQPLELSPKQPTFTLEQLNEERRKAWDARGEIITGRASGYKYGTFEDYLITLNTNQ